MMNISNRPLIDATAIQGRVKELAAQLDGDYQGRPLTVVVVLNGAMFFAADITRQMRADILLESIRVRSYTGTAPAPELTLLDAGNDAIAGRHILVLEDIVDSGRTAVAILNHFRARQAASISLCALLNKPARRIETVEPEYIGFTIDDHFVVGYGMDYNGRYRQLPHIYVLES